MGIHFAGRRLLVAFCLAASLYLPAAADMQTVRPERVGFDTERLERISDFMNARVEEGTMVGGLCP